MKMGNCGIVLILALMSHPVFGGFKQKKIEELEKENNQLTVNNTNLAEQLRDLKQELNALNASVYTNECLKVTCQNGGTCIDELNRYRCKCQPGWGGNLCETYEATVYAQFRSNELERFQAGDKVVFKTHIANVGNAYDIETGVFEAPVDGLYYFSTTICTGGQSGIWTIFHIVHEGVKIAAGQVGNPTWGHCSGVSAAAYMEVGSQAWVEYGSHGDNGYLDMKTDHSFTAILVNTRVNLEN